MAARSIRTSAQSSVPRRLVQLATAVALPLILLAGLSVWEVYQSERDRQAADLVDQAEAIAARIDDTFANAMDNLRVLAGSPALASNDIDTFDIELRQASAALGGPLIYLTAPSGDVVLSTAWAPGERRHGIKATEFALDALRANRAMASDLVVGPYRRLGRVGVAVPVASANDPSKPAWLLTLYFPVDGLAAILASLHLPPGWVVSVADRALHTVVRSAGVPAGIGRLPPPDLVAALAKASAGILGGPHRTGDGVPAFSAFARAPQTGYVVAIGIPLAAFTAPLRAVLIRAGLTAALLTALGLAGALLLARRIVGGLRAVAAAAPGQAAPTGLREIDELAAAIGRAEASRQEIAENFRLLAETIPGWVFATDAAGHNTYVNATMIEQTGLSEAALLRDGWVSIIHPDDTERVQQIWRQAVESGIACEIEYRVRVRDGNHRWFLVRAAPRRDHSPRGAPRGDHSQRAAPRGDHSQIDAGAAEDGPRGDATAPSWFGVAIDIHDQREAELAVRTLNQELESRVLDEIAARETAQLRAAQAERQQALGQLAGGIAHDFNNILQGVQGAATLLERRSTDAEQVGKLAHLITEAAGRGAAITRRLLALSRRDHLQPELVDPLTLLLAMRDLLLHTIGDGIVIEVEAAAGLPGILADKGSLETALINLATNARDAMAGIGRLGLAAHADDIPAASLAADQPHRPAALKPGGYVRISVSDTGTGMDSATLARASEPFFTTKPVGTGTGLGLAMARGFAEQSGGGLEIETELGRGTTIHLWLPQATEANLAEQRRPAPAEESPSPPPISARDLLETAPVDDQPVSALGNAGRLLLVDDDAVVRQTLAAEMTDAGYSVITAASAAYALALLDAGEAIDLIVSDLSMPGMNGAVMLREAQQRRPGIKAILVTGFATEAIAGAAVTVLHKPVSGAELSRQVAALLRSEPVAG
jgi:PAS domain S-box-containing protein